MEPRDKVIWEFSDQILDLVDHQDEYTRSDLQGRASAIIGCALTEYEAATLRKAIGYVEKM
jgi:hypothetical protein